MDNNDSNLVDMDADLSEFENTFYGKTEEGESEKTDEAQDTGDDAAETDEDTDAPEGDEDEADEASDEDSEDDSDDEEEEEQKEEPQQKKGRNRKSLQTRIDELTRRAHEAERERAEVLRRLEEKEAQERKVTEEKPIQANLPPGAPDPEATGEDGEPLYPLGLFDPAYIEAITRFTIERELENKRIEQEKQVAAKALQEAQDQLKAEWAEKLDAAEESNPEIRDDIGELVENLSYVEPAYGEYLALTIMQSENGPQILEYLSHNIGEAQKIVASGPAAATLALGRLDAMFSKTEPKRNSTKVSHASEPPEQVTKGRKGQRNVRPDTDNLSDFEKVFYNK